MKITKIFFYTPILLLNLNCATRKEFTNIQFASVAESELCSQQRTTMLIPKIFHQIWLDWGKGKPNPPDQYIKWSEELKAMNPEWKYMYWKNDNSREFLKEHYSWFLDTYDHYERWINRVDALRYFILDYYGGLYLDFDTQPLRPVDPLLAGCDLVFGEEYGSKHIINNDFMGSVPHHPFWKTVQEHLVKVRTVEDILYATGPFMLTDRIIDYKKNDHSPFFKVYGNEYFHPLGPDQAQSEEFKVCATSLEKCKDIFPKSYTLSQYAGAWH